MPNHRRPPGRAMKIVGCAKPMNYRGLSRRKIVDQLGLKYHWCGVVTDNSIYNEESPRKTTIDHIYNKLDPRREGNNDKVVVACEACNCMRARMHEYIFGQRNLPIKYALEIEKKCVIDIDTVVQETSIEPTKIEPPRVLNPVIQGPRIVRDVPPLTRWQKFIVFASLKLWKLKQRSKKWKVIKWFSA